jgi:hypothetical protein
LKDPDPFGFTALFDKPTPFTIQPSGAVAAFVSPTRALDITSWSDFAILSRLTSGWLWLDAVEPAKVARETDSFAVARGVHSVLLSPDYSGILSVPLGARMTSLGMFPLGLEGPIDPPPGLHDVKGAYSAIESTVYMVGGTLDSGEAAGTVWRWSLQRSNWDLLSTDRMGRYVPSSNVLSVGYTPNGQHLYVLDLDDDDAWVLPQGKHQLARLYRIDLAQGGSTLLGRFPFVSKSKLTSIAVLPDGTLAVVSATDKHYSVWRLDATGSKPVFKGVLAGSGRVLAQPVMGEDRLFLAVQRAGKIEMVDLDADQFHGGQPFTSL